MRRAVTDKQHTVTEEAQNVTNTGRDTLARARPSYGGDVTLSRRDTRVRDVTVDRDSDSPSLELRTVTITVSDQGLKSKLMKDPRFAAWIAGQPEQPK
jgi:hypothetical protein